MSTPTHQKLTLSDIVDAEDRVLSLLAAARHCFPPSEDAENEYWYAVFKPRVMMLVGWGRPEPLWCDFCAKEPLIMQRISRSRRGFKLIPDPCPDCGRQPRKLSPFEATERIENGFLWGSEAYSIVYDAAFEALENRDLPYGLSDDDLLV